MWATSYVPLIAQRQKWHEGEDNLKENDVVYFKLKDSKLAQQWHIGKIEIVHNSKDGKVRTVSESYKYDTEHGERKFSIVERPVREIVRLFNIEDTSLLEDIAAARKLAVEILDSNNIVPRDMFDSISVYNYNPSQNGSDFIQSVLDEKTKKKDDEYFAKALTSSDYSVLLGYSENEQLDTDFDINSYDDSYDLLLL